MLLSESRAYADQGHMTLSSACKLTYLEANIWEHLNILFANIHFSFSSEWFPFGGFELEWSLVAASLEGFSVTSHQKRVRGAPFSFKGIKRV